MPMSTDPTTELMMKRTALQGMQHLDSLTHAVKDAQDWFNLRHELFNFSSYAFVGVSLIVSALILRRK